MIRASILKWLSLLFHVLDSKLFQDEPGRTFFPRECGNFPENVLEKHKMRDISSLGRYVFGSEISYNKARAPGVGWGGVWGQGAR